MFWLLGLLASFALSTVAYAQTRRFVTRRLRYVDAVQTPIAPIVAGIIGALIAMPLVAIIPILGAGTAIAVGLSVGFGVLQGARDVRNRIPGY